MSFYYIQAKEKSTGEEVRVSALDNFFGGHEYGYAPNYRIGTKPYPPEKVLTAEEFKEQFEVIK